MNKIVEKKELKNYTVRVETMVPAILTFTVRAYNEQDAAEEVIKNRVRHRQIDYKLNRRRDKKITVYDYLSSIIRFIKNIIN